MMDGFEEHNFENHKNQKFQIRHAHLPDVPGIVSVMYTLWFDSPTMRFQSPLRHKYPGDALQRFYVIIRSLLFDTRQVSLVAVPLSDDSENQKVVAYARFVREGDDTAARQFMSAQWSLWNTLLGWYFSIETKVRSFIWPNRSLDKEARKQANEIRERLNWKYWKQPDMKARYGNRWHVTSLMILPEWQRQGLGQHLMQLVLNQAEKERVVVGLESTIDGEKLYSQLRFQLRGEYEVGIGDHPGYYMMWTPPKME